MHCGSRVRCKGCSSSIEEHDTEDVQYSIYNRLHALLIPSRCSQIQIVCYLLRHQVQRDGAVLLRTSNRQKHMRKYLVKTKAVP